MLKLYIAVRDDFPDFMTPTLVAHSVLSAHMKMHGVSAAYDDWLANSFKKVVVKVNEKEFTKISALDGMHHVGHENSTLDGRGSCIVIEPRLDTPNVLRFAKLWKPN